MNIIRVFPRKTTFIPDDKLAFVGFSSNIPKEQLPVRISTTFTWDIPEAERLKKLYSFFYNDVKVGGVAYGDPGGEFTPGLFLKKGMTITSRGCNKKCTWCHVPNREGILRELKIKDGWVIQDNNLLQCSNRHIEKVFNMLKQQPKAVSFKGGLDTSILNEWHRKLLDQIRLKEIWVACDTPSAIKTLQKASRVLDGIKMYKKFCFVLIGFNNETQLEAEKRLEQVYNLGFLPFAQLYQPEKRIEYSKEWKSFARTWSRPAAFKTYMKNKANDALCI